MRHISEFADAHGVIAVGAIPAGETVLVQDWTDVPTNPKLAPKWDHARGIYVAQETEVSEARPAGRKLQDRDRQLARVLTELQRDAVRSGRERMVC
jgi:hypothetical protein